MEEQQTPRTCKVGTQIAKLVPTVCIVGVTQLEVSSISQIVLYCRISVDTERGLQNTTIVVKDQETGSGIRFPVTAIRNGRSTTKTERTLRSAMGVVADIIRVIPN